MKKIILVITVLLFQTSLLAKSELPELESKLWNYIASSQVKEHRKERFIGGWPTYSRIKGVLFRIKETNSFLPAQLLVSISDLNQHFKLPGVNKVIERANENFERYLQDGYLTDEPEGTLSYWPIMKTKKGKLKRTFSVRWPVRNMKILNLPNDFDSSSQAFMWFYLNGINSNYLDSFVQTVGGFVDNERSVQHKNDSKWKGRSSGAILTWVERDRVDNSASRIYAGINDVDCVVNLNVLTALTTYEKKISSLTLKTKKAYQSTCDIINKAVLDSKTNKCGVWYNRSSQFYTAYVKALNAGASCLDSSKKKAKEEITNISKKILKRKGKGKYTEIAEYITALKKFTPIEKRTKEEINLISSLQKKLLKGIKIKKNKAYVKTKDSLFTGKVYGMRFNWYSRAFSTALALEALTLK